MCNVSATLTDADECWTISHTVISRGVAYRIFGLVVLFTLVPFAYFDVSKTKYMQLLTTLFRWGSFSTMIALAAIALAEGKGRGDPQTLVVAGLPNLFGVCVYSFMCHHSLPTLITPISNKKNVFRLIFANYILILAFYLLLSLTGAYTFNQLQDIYTLNFQQEKLVDSFLSDDRESLTDSSSSPVDSGALPRKSRSSIPSPSCNTSCHSFPS